MTTRDDLIEYGEKYGWVSAEHRTPEYVRLVRPGRPFNVHEMDIQIRNTRIAQVFAIDRTGRGSRILTLTGGVPTVKRYLREHGVR